MASKTILLINPPIYDFAAHDLFSKPLGLLYIASFLRAAGFNVRLIDALDRHDFYLIKHYGPAKSKPDGSGKYHGEKIPKPKCLSHIPRYYRRYGLPESIMAEKLAYEQANHPPQAVLVTSMMTYWYPAVRDTIAQVRQLIPNTPIALGGIYASLLPDHARQICKPDKLFTQGQLFPILDWLDSITDSPANRSNLVDQFPHWPIPAYDLYSHNSYLTLITSLGCPYHCDYCASRRLQPKMSRLTPQAFLNQLNQLIPLLKDNPQYNIAFADDALLASAEEYIIPILESLAELPMDFHCYTPNGLHCRFITPRIAQLMYQNKFDMIRLSYEASDATARWQAASDNKITDRHFRQAYENLIAAGYTPSSLDAYVLAGLPGQTMDEVATSARVVHQLGMKVKLSQFTPIPGTKLFESACNEYGVDPNEPLLHNNTILPALDRRASLQTFQQFKDYIVDLNNALPTERNHG